MDIQSECVDVILHCSNDLINNCKELQEIFYYSDGQRKRRVDIVQIKKDGYLVKFELNEVLFVLPAEESGIESEKTETLSRTLLASNEQLEMGERSPTRTSNDETNVENTEAVPLSENESNSQGVAETNSVK